VRKSALTLIAVAIVLSFGGCSKSSPTEPTFTASLYGTVAICGYARGLPTIAATRPRAP
jgi:hypothetical protein